MLKKRLRVEPLNAPYSSQHRGEGITSGSVKDLFRVNPIS